MEKTIRIYRTSPNQKTVITQKTTSDKDNTYGIFNVNATLFASRTLSDRAFKLYVRMNLHQDEYTYALSPVEIFNETGMSEKRYREAVKELIEKRFLLESDHKGVFFFRELPDVDEALSKRREQPVTLSGSSTPKQTVPPGISDSSSSIFGNKTQPTRTDHLPVLGGEIIHDTTKNNTKNTTFNTTQYTTRNTTRPLRGFSSYDEAEDIYSGFNDDDMPF